MSTARNDSSFGTDFGPVVRVVDAPAAADILLVCEHASNAMPAGFGGLGLDRAVLDTHVAWDPGALGVATGLAAQLAAPLVHGCVSRLVYDCNRPPEARDAIPAASEVYDIPGNAMMSGAERQARIDTVYLPFRARLADEIAARRRALALLVTVHSFTPRYRGVPRDVQIGLLHGRDAKFAEAMLRNAPEGLDYVTRLNDPYSAADGVAHTLDLHGAVNGLPSVMLEIRNDLLTTAADQAAMADLLAPWIRQTLTNYQSGAAA